MGRNLRPRLTFESLTDCQMNPDEFRTLRRERLRPFDQIEWLPGVRPVRRQQQGSRGQITRCRVCNEDAGLSISLGSKGLGICAASSRMRTPSEREHAKQCNRSSQFFRAHIKLLRAP
jgi:hypothetical protein